ncbi:MAG: RICIN domain-containing protein [Firmicutes bacterium]|nr:RICIN domain-containing protein [Bacillota bacterium]
MARTIVADPNRSIYVYNLLNESENSWYASSGTGLTKLCNEWKQMYQKVRSIDAGCKIMGPSFATYNGSAYRTFFSFCQSNGCMPDIATWHELGNDFYTSWYSHYNDFRSIPGCSSIPICINEYARSSGDLGVPGNLIQHLAKYENSNVYGCLAYWTGHGTLNDLVANNNTNQQAIGSSYNQPTGAWYLYQWYGQMTGNQVAVTPPSQEGSLQGIASKDGDNVTILFGGGTATYDVNVVVQGLSGSSINYTVYETTNTGRNAASAPGVKKSGTATVSGGAATISVTGCSMYSAFKISITPGSGGGPTPTPPPSGSYIKLRNVATGLYIDGMGRTSWGNNAGQWSNSTSYNQQWVLEAAGSYYRIKNRATGLYLDGMGRTSNGSICGQWGYDSTSNNQQWAQETVGSYYRFKNRATGLYLDGMGSTSNGADLCQWGNSGSTNQQWAKETL